jgi:hypothetical protein
MILHLPPPVPISFSVSRIALLPGLERIQIIALGDSTATGHDGSLQRRFVLLLSVPRCAPQLALDDDGRTTDKISSRCTRYFEIYDISTEHFARFK